MTAAAVDHPNWPEFAQQLAELSGVPRDEIRAETRLVADLALDSLALAELVVSLIERYAPASMVRDLEDHDWDRMTAGNLFDECMAGSGKRADDRIAAVDQTSGRG
jgi:GAF domain-containing protein